MIYSRIVISLFLLFCGTWTFANSEVYIDKGIYKPFFREVDEQDVAVGPLWVDRYPVTNREFAAFIDKYPNWSKSKIPKIFSSPTYLSSWSSSAGFSKNKADYPVVDVTWYVARKYCESKGKRLLTVAEWEYVSDSQNPENLTQTLNWYGKPNKLSAVKKSKKNSFGLSGMHGLIWEWVEDFSSAIMAGDSRDANDTSRSFFCGSGSLKAKDPTQYATFMRFAHRSSLKANYTGSILGFRCARDLSE